MNEEFCTITTVCDSIENADKIIDVLLKKKLISGSQMITIKSNYIWKNELVEKIEYLMIMKSITKLYKEIELNIKEIHVYEVPEIALYRIDCGNIEFLNWIKKNTLN